MQVLKQIHVNDVPPSTKIRMQHEALEMGMSLSRWLNCLFAYVIAHPGMFDVVYREWMDSNGLLGTDPELPAIERQEVPV